MDSMNIDEFETYITSICSKSSIVMSMAVIKSGFTWLKMRAYLIDESFVDISYNQETGKTTFAQIRDNYRIFGADNKKSWHWHPYDDPQRHEFTNAEITFINFLTHVEENIKK